MDWTKAKSILIVALIVTNLVLIFTYTSENELFRSSDDEVAKETIQLLERKNIYVKTEIPEKHNPMATLSVEYDDADRDLIDEKLEQQTPVRGILSNEELQNMTKDFIQSCGLLTENVKFDHIRKNGEEFIVTYKNYIDKIAIEDSYINCTVKDGKITNIERYWLKPVDKGPAKKAIIPAEAALMKFMSENEVNEINEKINIEDISLVYWLDTSAFDTESPVSDTAFPAWKISYNHGKKIYILAYEQ